MFDLFSGPHILLLLIVALVVVGPKDLPKLMRTAGQWTAKARGMANEFRKSFDDMARQSELDELRSELEALRNERPLADVHDALNNAIVPPDMQSKPSVSVSSEDVMTPIVHEPVEPEPPLPDPATVTDVLKNPPAP